MPARLHILDPFAMRYCIFILFVLVLYLMYSDTLCQVVFSNQGGARKASSTDGVNQHTSGDVIHYFAFVALKDAYF